MRRISNAAGDVQLIRPIGVQVVSDINREMKVPACVVSGVLAIDEDGGFVIDCTEIEKNTLIRADP
jgi:hypothetical protein